MKKILSLVITLVMLASTVIIPANAAGSLLFSDSFDMGFKPANWIQGPECEFEWDDEHQCIQGYDPAVVLQSNFVAAKNKKVWDQFYTSFDVQVRGFDDLGEVRDSHSVALWYRDLFKLNDSDAHDEGAVYMFNIELETGKVTVNKSHTFKYRDANNILQEGKIDVCLAETVVPGIPETLKEGETAIPVGEKAPWFEIGMRVTPGKLECYYNQECIVSLEADPTDEKLGNFALNSVDSTLGSKPGPILFWNMGNWVGVDNFEVWTPDYDFVAVTYGDVNGDTKINLTDVSKLLQYVAKWNVENFAEAAADVNADGKVNLSDAARMLQYIAKWEVTLGPTA